MKKLSPERKSWLLSRQIRIRHRERLNRRAGQFGAVRAQACVIRLPKVISSLLPEWSGKLYGVLNALYSNCSAGTPRIKLDFSSVQLMRADGMLVLLAHVEILTALYPGLIQARCPAGSLAAQLLHWFDMGKLLGVSYRGNAPSHAMVTGWQFFHGTRADGASVGKFLAKLRNDYQLDLPDHLYDALVESVTNVSHHAYPADMDVRIATEFQRWWLFAYCDPPKGDRPGDLSIAIFDLGVGIIEHMKHRFNFGEAIIDKTAKLLDVFGATTRTSLDMSLLRETIELGRSSTKLPHRGKGLPEMLEFTIGTKNGEFYVLTGGILYSRQAARQSSIVAKSAMAPLGTLLCWYVPVRATPKEMA